MGGFDREPGRAWDEYDWERFLQQQDQKTEKYMELLEKYLDDPQRDEIIAREMGWSQLLDAKDWSAEVETLLNEDWRSNDEDLQQRLFQVRDGIINLMGEYRGEWRRRFGSEGFRS